MFGTNVQALLRVKSKVKYAGVWCISFPLEFSITPSRRNGPDRTTLEAWWGTFFSSFFFLLLTELLVSRTECGNEKGDENRCAIKGSCETDRS